MSILGKLLNPFGGSSDVRTSTQSSATNTTNTATDKRVVADGGGIGISGDFASLDFDTNTYETFNMIDGGALDLARDLANAGMYTGTTVGGMGLYTARDLGGRALDVAQGMGGRALEVAQGLGGDAFGAGRDIALAGLADNANNVAHLLDTADHLFTQQQKVTDLNAGLASVLASKVTGTADTGVKTAGVMEDKQLVIGGALVLLAIVLATRGGK